MKRDLKLAEGVDWSIHIEWLESRTVVASLNADQERRVASVPKLALLAACAKGVADGWLDLDEHLDRRNVERVGDSGLWQHLRRDTLAVDDVATLIGVASDNLATNVLLARIGLGNVRATSETLGLGSVSLHDRVRDVRLPEHADTLGTATMHALSTLMGRIASDKLGDAGVGERVEGWLKNSLDLSMVAAAFDLDPLSHASGHSGPLLVNKTGTDTGVRADTGYIRTAGSTLIYAAAANWDPTEVPTSQVMCGMRAIGLVAKQELERQVADVGPGT